MGQAIVLAGAGNKQGALDNLEQAYRERELDLLYTVFDPRLDSIGNEPKFRRLISKPGIPEHVR